MKEMTLFLYLKSTLVHESNISIIYQLMDLCFLFHFPHFDLLRSSSNTRFCFPGGWIPSDQLIACISWTSYWWDRMSLSCLMCWRNSLWSSLYFFFIWKSWGNLQTSFYWTRATSFCQYFSKILHWYQDVCICRTICWPQKWMG